MRLSRLLLALSFVGWCSVSLGKCPDLSSFRQLAEEDWELTRLQLGELFDQCLLSTEFFALLGAAQLNTSRLSEAIESLERALLLDPNNGAALIDYSEALLVDGQLFAAIEINELLLAREDSPLPLRVQIEKRQRDWESLTKQTSWQFDLLGGYDSNLNGAPDEDVIALTLSGEPIFLTLSEEYQAIEGPFLNARVQARHRRLAPDYQDVLYGQLRGRLSDDYGSDAAQFSARYSRLRAPTNDTSRWDLGFNHLMFRGQSLFSGLDAGYRRDLLQSDSCTSFLSGALQQQIWHQQRRLNGLEIKASAGASCSLGANSDQELTFEAGVLHNVARYGNRLGGNRDGWQVGAGWRSMFDFGEISAQIGFTGILDSAGFSSLLENNARRRINRSSIMIQFKRDANWLGQSAHFIANLYHQDQQSQISLFETKDTSVGIGFSWEF